MNPHRISELKQQSDKANKIIFLCGGAEGEDKVWHYFDKVFALIVDVDTLKQRIANRTDNDFGKHPEELVRILRWHTDYEDNFRKLGATIVDATQPVKRVVDEIVQYQEDTLAANNPAYLEKIRKARASKGNSSHNEVFGGS